MSNATASGSFKCDFMRLTAQNCSGTALRKAIYLTEQLEDCGHNMHHCQCRRYSKQGKASRPHFRDVLPAGRVGRGPPLLLHCPALSFTCQSGAGNQNRPLSKPLIQAIQCGHQLAVIWSTVTFQFQLSLTDGVSLQVHQDYPSLRVDDPWSKDRSQPSNGS